jgi:hypothetical protein
MDTITDTYRPFRGLLTNDEIEAIKPGNPAPLFKPNGQPMLDAFDRPVTASYTHAARAMFKLMVAGGLLAERIGGEQVPETVLQSQMAGLTTADLSRLNVFYGEQLFTWQPTDMLVFTADNYLLLTQRSHYTKNARGRALNSASGFPKVIDGMPETAEACGVREAAEEICLDLKGPRVKNTIDLGLITNRPVQFYMLETNRRDDEGVPVKVPGAVPATVRTFAVQLNTGLYETIDLLMLNPESVGIAALSIDNLELLAYGKGINLPYFASTAPFACPLFAEGAVSLSLIREGLETLAPITALDRAELNPLDERERTLRAAAHDFMHDGSRENMAKAMQAMSIITKKPLAPDMQAFTRPYFPRAQFG